MATLDVGRYRKRAPLFEAVQFERTPDGGSNADAIVDWINQDSSHPAYKILEGSAAVAIIIQNPGHTFYETPQLRAEVGDWIVRHYRGKYSVYESSEFRSGYVRMKDHL